VGTQYIGGDAECKAQYVKKITEKFGIKIVFFIRPKIQGV